MAYINMLKSLWKYAEQDRGKIVVYFMFHVVSVFGLLVQPYAFSMIINTLQKNSIHLISQVLFWLGIYALGFAVFNVFHRAARLKERYVAFKAKKRFLVSTYGILQSLTLKWHSENHSGNVIDRVNKAGDAIYYFGQFQANCIEVIIKFIGAFIMLTVISPVISSTAVLTGFLMVYITKKLYDISVPEYRAQNEGFHKISAAIFDYIKNITTIIVLRLGRLVQNDLDARLDEILPHITKENRVTQIKCFVNEFIVLLLNVGLIFYYIASRNAVGAVVMAGSITAIFQYLGQLLSGFQFYSFSYEDIIHWNTNFKAMSPIYAAYNLNESGKKSKYKDNEKIEKVNSKWNHIKLGPFHYSYGEGRAGLHNVCVEMKKGQRIAFIGESGAGKSTLLRVMRGLIPIKNLSIRIDTKNADIKELENITTFIPQEAEVFENTVLYNITMGLTASQDEIDKSAKLACFDTILEKLPKGYETDIRENGVNLSGGEKQRLSLTRGIYSIKDSSIVLLDEPTGSLDSATELSIYKRIIEEMPDKCIVSALHRLHLLYLFDYVYVFKEGKIVEEGSFNKLLENKEGEFNYLWGKYLLNKEEDFQ